MTVVTANALDHIIDTVAPKQATDKRLPLPTERALTNAPGQGWLVPTTVKNSNIPEAGNGRFANVDIPKGTVIMSKPMTQMSDVSSLHAISYDEVIIFKNKEDLERFLDMYVKEGNQSRKDVFEYMTHYIFSLSTSEGVTLNFSSAAVNHGDPGVTQNTVSYELDGKHLFKTVADVKAGDELLVNYRNYDFNQTGKFWLDFCKKEGVDDLFTNMD
mmetsp:Transcript_26385/g.40498  ORF Transcript_26385/g.40498 Transcript_26385/m.40498 type:complete len:215 (-) Transcript_26385:155-799(-)|eukprot:CAMPEP_0195286844 /NCGR_PEP_ID=MMETSP0707-20130614/4151_1 /TAXON_ID=33640 /ORGANISM="Asterionellopsis glacialis, Strain CCMP134" /LENGTH=214 /DNA_ID=CAMNT_0040346539 /DNA_START=32 /DNA_END=676 /DNA_ORIENTATION=+